MKAPRRIFRSSGIRPGLVGRTMLAWAAGLGLLVAVVSQSSALFGSAPAGPERIQAEADQVAVVGGDTLRLGGRVVRLAGIEAPGRGESCRGMDCGAAATMVLAGLVQGRRVACSLTGQDAMGRPYGACEANGTDLGSAVVGQGWARAEANRPALAVLESRARQQRAGLWAQTAH